MRAASLLGERNLRVYWLLVLPLLVIVLGFYAYPILKILWISVTDPEPGVGNYRALLANDGVHRVMLVTLRVCLWTTTLALVFGYVVAYAMTHVAPRHRLWMTFFVLVPFWVSVLVRAFAWVALLRDNGMLNTLLQDLGITDAPVHLVRNQIGVVIGMVHYMMPYAILPIFANMRGINPSQVAAARGLGAGPFEAFWRVFLPQTIPGIAGSAVLVFIVSLGFFITPVILGGGRTVMIAEYVSVQILQTVRWGFGTMLATTLLLAVFFLLAVMSRFVNLRELYGAK